MLIVTNIPLNFEGKIFTMDVAILVYPHCSLWSAYGPMELLMRANKVQDYFNKGQKHLDYFKVELVSSDKKLSNSNTQYPANCHTSIYNQKTYDTVIIPGFDYDPLTVVAQSTEAIHWIKHQYGKGAKIASICTGSFLLAKTGVLSNKRATTHWLAADTFHGMFPNVKLCRDEIIIDNGNILMSGGATSFHNLVLHLIEEYMGRKVAVWVSKIFLIDIYKDKQDSYSSLINQKKHTDKEILEAQTIIEKSPNNKISIQEIADKLSMSSRNFIRRFKSATGDTPFKYMQKVKVEEAKRIMETENKSFEEIVFELAYEDINAFRKIFVKYTGILPSDYKKRYTANTLSTNQAS